MSSLYKSLNESVRYMNGEISVLNESSFNPYTAMSTLKDIYDEDFINDLLWGVRAKFKDGLKLGLDRWEHSVDGNNVRIQAEYHNDRKNATSGDIESAYSDFVIDIENLIDDSGTLRVNVTIKSINPKLSTKVSKDIKGVSEETIKNGKAAKAIKSSLKDIFTGKISYFIDKVFSKAEYEAYEDSYDLD